MDKETDQEAEVLLSCEEELEEVDLVDTQVEGSHTETLVQQKESKQERDSGQRSQGTQSVRVRESLSRFGKWWPIVELKALVKLALPTVSVCMAHTSYINCSVLAMLMLAVSQYTHMLCSHLINTHTHTDNFAVFSAVCVQYSCSFCRPCIRFF